MLESVSTVVGDCNVAFVAREEAHIFLDEGIEKRIVKIHRCNVNIFAKALNIWIVWSG